LGLVETEVLADRILVALEEALDERLVDDRDRRGRFVVRLRERASARHGGAEVLQVVRAHANPRRAGVVAGLRRRMTGDHDHLAPVVRQRVVEREVRRLHAGNAVQPVFQSAVHGRQLRHGVVRGRTVDRDEDAIRHGEPEVLMLDVVEAAAEHRRAGDEDDGQRRLEDQERGARE
jgi:hypothetical protein